MTGSQKDNQPRRGEQGFTIMEVLIAMLLFAVMLAGMAAMQVTILRASTDARVTSVATELAQSRLEDYRSMTFTSVQTLVTDTTCLSRLSDRTRASTCCFTYAGETANCGSAAEFFQRIDVVSASGSFCNGTGTVSTAAKGIEIRIEWIGQGGGTTPGCTAGKTCVRLCMEIAP